MEQRMHRTFVFVSTLTKSSTGWFFSTYVLFLLSHGLTLQDATVINFTFMLGRVIFEPPTGHWADRFGQKRIYMAGQLTWALAMFIYGIGNSFQHFLLAELVGAFGSSLMFGALDGWLRNNTNPKEANRSVAKAAQYGVLATIPTALAGGAIGSFYGYQWTWIAASLSSFLGFVISWRVLRDLPESYKEKISFDITELILQSLRVRQLRFTIIVTFSATLAVQSFNMFWAPVLKDLSGSAWWLGSMWLGIAMFTAIGARIGGNEYLQGRPKQAIALMVLIMGAPMVFTSLLGNVGAVVLLFLLHELGRGGVQPLMFAYANEYIDSSVRSSLNSIRSSFSTLGAAIGLLAAGFLTNVFYATTIWGLSAVLLLILSIWSWRKED